MEIVTCAVVVLATVVMVNAVGGTHSIPEALYSRGCRATRGQFPHEAYCDQYYNCWDGRATVEQCAGDLLFNAAISACDYPQAVVCGARARNAAPYIVGGRCLKEWGTFPDPVDCTAFYECDHGRAFRKVCPFYTAFDPHVLVCVHAHDVDCAGRGGVYGTLAPPVYPLPDSSPGSGGRTGGVSGARSRVGSSGAGSFVRRPGAPPPAPVGWDRRQPQQPSSLPSGAGGTGTGGSGVLGGAGSSRGSVTSPSGIAGTRGSDGSSTGINGGRDVGGSTSGGGRSSVGTAFGGISGTRGANVIAGLTGIVDKDFAATGQEQQYERPLSPEATFRCPHPRGLYPYALDCTRFWLCREYRPSLLKCPVGQLFDLASLTCTQPEKAQCSSLAPRT